MKLPPAAKSFAVLFTLAAPAAQAQQFPPGVDPNLAMALDQMISFVWQGCQMGDQMSCQNVQAMQAQAQNLIAAGQYCWQTNDPNACAFYQTGYQQAQMAYMQMSQASGGQMMATPGYNPGNPLGATHEDRMANIANWGAQNTANWNSGQAQIDANHNAFLNSIRQ